VNVKDKIKKSKSIQTVIVFILVVFFFMYFFPDKEGKSPSQEPQQTTTAAFDSEPHQKKITADARTDAQKLNDFIVAIKSLDMKLDNADITFKHGVHEAVAGDSPERLRIAFDTYDNEVVRLDILSDHLPATFFKTDYEGTVLDRLTEAMEAQSKGIAARRNIAKNFDKIKPGNLASALAYIASENVNEEDILRARKEETTAINAAKKAAKRAFVAQ
jgi:hypothetical protein